ncbi:outer membrane receptor for Fe3+-dicitrate [Spongiibacter sp. IMCC21906]|jgi:Fe(3+) dicitrate transport protein|uniref:TonB-dependent receptor family protein n=1 Tax=Spongiibacter sp. IMCC21906 TaxID=1620392 RepID=UPI00062DE85D|nr:TonB-dependent receptor [Spongiibacter sp. IMCC21906]AKH68831.1 outer membrane receptor for Fe3+-dicitrate [Spongiibacter sp. IMCC21906]
MRRLLLAAGAVSTASLGLADTSGQQGRENLKLEQITIVGERVEEIAGSAYVLDQAELEKFEYVDIHRMVRQVPGVYFQEEDGYGLRANIGIRGSGSGRTSKITLMEDGVLVAPAPYADPAAYYFPTSGRMAGVEVLKGPQTLLYGPYTVGGALNLKSTPIPEQREGFVNVEIGENSAQKSHVHYGATEGQWGFLLESYQEETLGFKDIDRSNRDTGYDKEDYVGKLRWRSAEGATYAQQLDLKVNYTEEQSNVTYLGVTDAQFDRDPYRRYGLTELDQMNTRQAGVSLRHNIEFSDTLALSSMIYRNNFKRSWFKLDRVGSDSIGGLIDKANNGDALALGILEGTEDATDVRVKDNAREYYGEGIQFELAGNVEAAGAAHNWVVGIRQHEDESDRFQPVSVYNQVNGSLQFDSIIQPGSGDNRVDEAEALSIWVMDRISMGQLDITLSLRHEDIDTAQTRYGDLDRNTVASTRSNDVEETMAGLGATYVLNDSWQLLAGVHQGFAPPGGGAADGTGAEESLNYEFGGRYRSEYVSADIVAFFSDYDNTVNNCSIANPCSDGAESGTESFGESEIRGLELSLRTVLLESASFQVPLTLAYTYTDAEVTKDADGGDVLKGDNLPYLPENLLNLGLGIEDNRGRKAYLSATYVDEMCVDNQCERSVDQRFRSTDSYVSVDFAASMPVAENVEVYTRIDNLLDDESIVARSPAGARVNLPRTAYLGVRVSF